MSNASYVINQLDESINSFEKPGEVVRFCSMRMPFVEASYCMKDSRLSTTINAKDACNILVIKTDVKIA